MMERKIIKVWEKKFDLISKEAKKNNIEMMLSEKKILTFSHWVEENEYEEIEIYSKSFGGMLSEVIQYPCQSNYREGAFQCSLIT